jgi:hypothetical protein
MRGENRDYVPTRQKGVEDNTCDPSEGCAFKAKATKRDPFFRQKIRRGEGVPSAMNDLMLFTMGEYDE